MSGDGPIPARWQEGPHTEGDMGISLKVAKEETVWTFVGKLPNTEQPKGKDTEVRWGKRPL